MIKYYFTLKMAIYAKSEKKAKKNLIKIAQKKLVIINMIKTIKYNLYLIEFEISLCAIRDKKAKRKLNRLMKDYKHFFKIIQIEKYTNSSLISRDVEL